MGNRDSSYDHMFANDDTRGLCLEWWLLKRHDTTPRLDMAVVHVCRRLVFCSSRDKLMTTARSHPPLPPLASTVSAGIAHPPWTRAGIH